MNNITTILFLSLVIVAHAQASEPTVITLSCEGTVKTNVGNNEGHAEIVASSIIDAWIKRRVHEHSSRHKMR